MLGLCPIQTRETLAEARATRQVGCEYLRNAKWDVGKIALLKNGAASGDVWNACKALPSGNRDWAVDGNFQWCVNSSGGGLMLCAGRVVFRCGGHVELGAWGVLIWLLGQGWSGHCPDVGDSGLILAGRRPAFETQGGRHGFWRIRLSSPGAARRWDQLMQVGPQITVSYCR